MVDIGVESHTNFEARLAGKVMRAREGAQVATIAAVEECSRRACSSDHKKITKV